MQGARSHLEELIAMPKEGCEAERRNLLREMTNSFITAADRYGAKDKQYLDLMFSRYALMVDINLRRYLAMIATKAEAEKFLVKQVLAARKKSLGLILRRSTTQTVPDLVNNIRERISFLFNTADTHFQNLDDFSDGKRFTLPIILQKEIYRFISLNITSTFSNNGHDEFEALLLKASSKQEDRIIEDSMAATRDEILALRKQISELERRNGITEDYLLELLMTDNRTELILALSSMLNVDNATMQRILNDPTWEPLALTCRAAGMTRVTFANLVNSMNKRQNDEANSTRIITMYNAIPEDAALRAMRFWQIRATTLGDVSAEVETPAGMNTQAREAFGAA